MITTVPSHRTSPPRLVERARLGAPTAHQPLMLAVGLPGSGRTTWLRQVLARTGRTVISERLAIAPGVAVFVSAPDHVLRLLVAGDGRTSLIDRCAQTALRSGPTVLIGLDDIHLADPPVAQRLARQVEQLAHLGVRVAMTSRWVPDWPLARWRLAGQLREIGDADLALEDHELMELARTSGHPDPTELGPYHEATGGWATSAAAARVGRLADLDPRLVDDLAVHLADLVVADLHPLDLPALRIASVLPSSSTELIRAIGGDDAARRLAGLQARHPALIRQPGDPAWWTVHPLVARGLRSRVDAAETMPAVEILARAATWHRAEGHLSQPVELLIEAGRWADALSHLTANSLRFAEEGRHHEFARLWAAIPPSTWEHDPTAVLTTALLSVGAGRASSAFDLLFRPPLTDFDLDPGIRAVALAVQGFLGPWSADPAASLRAAEQAIDLLPQVDEATLPPVTGVRASRPWVHLASVGAARAELLLGRWGEATARLQAAAGDETVGALVRLNLTATHARILALCGWLDAAAARSGHALASAAERSVTEHPAIVDAHLALAEVALGRNHLDLALDLAAEAERRARAQQCPTQIGAALAITAAVALRGGHPDQALGVLTGVGPLPPGHPRATVDAVRARAHLRLGDLADARRILATLPLGPATVLAHAEAAETTAGADAALTDWAAPDWPSAQVLGHLGRAIAVQRTGGDGSWIHLVAALEAAEPVGLLGPFAELPATLAAVLAALPATNGFMTNATQVAGRHPIDAAAAGVLTATEAAVLHALAEPLPLREVAAQLYVSANTLKSHVRNIYRKLGVTSRADAVEVARRLGLI